MPSWDAISNFMVERQENREMGQFDHVRMGAQGFVYPPLELSEDQLDDFGLPGIITAGGGLDEQLDTRPSATAVEPTMRDDLRVGTMNFLQDQFGMDKFKARRFSEQLIGSAGELSATALGIGVADLLPITAAPLTMQEGAQQFSEGMETGSGMDMAAGAAITTLGALESLPVFGAGFKMMNKAAQSEILREFIGTAADGFTRTGEVTQDTLIEAGEAAQARLDSMMSGTTLSANPVGAAADAMIAGAGRMAGARRSAEADRMVADDLVNRPELWGEDAPDINERREMVDAMLRGERFEGDEGVARLFNEHTERLSIAQAEPAPVFYSAVANAVDALPMERGNASQMRAMIAKSAEVKPEEMAWIGLDDFLKGKKSVTKQEIKEFVDANQVQIEEVVKQDSRVAFSIDEHRTRLENMNDEQLITEASDEFGIDPNDIREAMQDGTMSRDEYIEEILMEIETSLASRGIDDAGRLPGSNTKFSDYTLPGGENYREVLLRLPERSGPVDGRTPNQTAKDLFGDDVESIYDLSPEKQSILQRELDKQYEQGEKRLADNFTGGHFDEPNVLAHMRLNDRTGPNGEKILFVEEIQSDWHQKGRKQGYKTPKRFAEPFQVIPQEDPDSYIMYEVRDANGELITNVGSEYAQNSDQAIVVAQGRIRDQTRLVAGDDRVPDAPLKKTWHEMSFRRIARMAAEEGYDAIAWTPGKLQAERYDLSKQVSELRAQKHDDGTVSFGYIPPEGGNRRMLRTFVPDNEIEGLVGKEMAEKIRGQNQEIVDYSGVDLEVGGEGMKGFYDKMLKGYASKWGKKFGAKVGVTNLEVVDTPSDNFVVIDGVAVARDFDTRAEAEAFARKENAKLEGTQVWTLPVTKKMRDSVLSKGVATFGAAGVAAGVNNEARPNGN